MSKLFACACFDSAVQAYMRPIFVAAPAAGVRSFVDEVNRKDDANPLYAHPDDFELRQLGIWDDETGLFENDLQLLCRAKDMKRE